MLKDKHVKTLCIKFYRPILHYYRDIQGCHWSGKSRGNSRSGKSQGILEFVREIWNFVESQGNLRKFIFHKRHIQKFSARAFDARIIFFNALHSKFAFIYKVK